MTATEFLQPALPQPVQQKKKFGRASLQQVFNASKTTIATHPKLCLQLIKLYQKADFDDFFAEFLDLLKICLVVGEKHPQVERTLSFVARFTTADKRPKEDKDDKDNQTGKENKPDEEVGAAAAKEKEVAPSFSSLSVTDSELEDDEVDPFLINMFQFLLNNHEANSNSVRYRVCQLINRILNSMGESASLDDDLFSTIYDTMLQRLMDKKPAVRVQAILALNRLQDPRNKDCPVIKAYRYHLSMDPASDVRRAALLSTAITFQTLPDVLQRTRDKNHLVRRQAYLVLAQKVHIRSLQISQRVRLLSEGLNDRSDIVRLAVQKNLLQAWLRFVNGSVLDLLTCLDVEASTKGAELALDTLFLDVPASTLVQNFGLLGEDKLIPLGDIKPESVLYWKCLVKHLKKEQAEEELDLVLPDLSAFCAYTRTFALSEEPSDGEPEDEHAIALRQMEKEFVLQQLIHITTCYDLSDEVGRQSLEQLVRVLLVFERVGEGSINGLVDVFGRIYPPHSRVTQLAEIISDVREPAPPADGTVMTPAPADDSIVALGGAAADPAAEERAKQLSEDEQRANKIKVAKIRVQLNQVREELEECVRSLDLDRAQELKLKLRALELDHENIQQQVATPAQTPRSEHQRCTVSDTSSAEEEAVTSAASAATAAAAEELQEKDDPQTLARCLTIVCQMLRSPEITVITPTLHSLHDNLLLPCLENQEPLVRKLAVQALSLLCLVSKEMAQKHLLLFVQISQMDVEAIQLLALQAVFDLLLLYGVEQFSVATEGAANLTGLGGEEDQDDLSGLDDVNAVVAILSRHLESEECEVRTAVAMGLCKLLQASRITSPKLLTHLTLLWYNPITEEDTMLRHMLGVFFPLYASQGGSSQSCVVASVLPTLRALVDAPPRSSLAAVDVDDVANFLVSITSPAVVTKKTGGQQHVNLHDSLVFSVLGEILAFPDSALARNLCKMLRHLNLSPTNYTNLRQLQVLADKVAKKMRERTMQVTFEKFQASIKEYLKLAPVKEEREEPQEDAEPIVPPSADSSVTDMTLANKTIDATFARRRRQLYTTDADILSSEAESESGAPTFKEREDSPANVPKSEVGDAEQEAGAASAADAEADEGVTLVSSLQGRELELLDRSNSSEDMFASPELPSGGRHSGSSAGSRAKRSPRKAAPSSTDTDSEEENASLQSTRPSRKKRSTRKPAADSAVDIHSDASVKKGTKKTQSTKSSPQKEAAVVSDADSDTDDSMKLVTTQPSEVETTTTQDDSDCNSPSPVKSKRGGRVSGPGGASRGSRTAARNSRVHTKATPSSPAPRSGRARRSRNSSPIHNSTASSTDDEILSPTPSTPSEGKKRGARTRGTATTLTPSRKALKMTSEAPLTTVVETSSADSAESSIEDSPETPSTTASVIKIIRKSGRPKKSDSSISTEVEPEESTSKGSAAASLKKLGKESSSLPSSTASPRPRRSRVSSARLSSARESPPRGTGGIRRNIRGKPVSRSPASTDTGPTGVCSSFSSNDSQPRVIESSGSGSSSPASLPATKRIRRGRPSSSPARSSGPSIAVSSQASTVGSGCRFASAAKTPSAARKDNLGDAPSERSSSTAPRSTRAARTRK